MAARLLLSHFSRYFFLFLAVSILFHFSLFPTIHPTPLDLPPLLFILLHTFSLSPTLSSSYITPLLSSSNINSQKSLFHSSLFSLPSTLAFLVAEALSLSVKHHLPLFTLFFLFPCSSTSSCLSFLTVFTNFFLYK